MSVEPVVNAELVHTADEWAQVIKADLGRAVDGIVAAGRNLIAAKADVAHGEWLPMLKQIGISHAGAKKLMAIGRNEELANGSNSNHLPRSIDALYQLSRLGSEDIDAGIDAGTITPDMTIADARDLIGGQVDHQEKRIGADGVEQPAAEPPQPTEPVDLDIECSGCNRDFPPASITEMDYETLLCPGCLDEATGETPDDPAPAEPSKPRRRPLEEGFFDATTRLDKAVTSLTNLGNDDRLPRNKEQVARYRNDLLRAIDALQRVADQLT